MSGSASPASRVANAIAARPAIAAASARHWLAANSMIGLLLPPANADEIRLSPPSGTFGAAVLKDRG